MMFYPDEIQFIQDSCMIELLFGIAGRKHARKAVYLDGLLNTINNVIGDTHLGIVILALLISCYEVSYAKRVQYLDEAWDRWQDYCIIRSNRILEQLYGREYGDSAYEKYQVV